MGMVTFKCVFATHTTQNDLSTSGEEAINRHYSLRIFTVHVLRIQSNTAGIRHIHRLFRFNVPHGSLFIGDPVHTVIR